MSSVLIISSDSGPADDHVAQYRPVCRIPIATFTFQLEICREQRIYSFSAPRERSLLSVTDGDVRLFVEVALLSLERDLGALDDTYRTALSTYDVCSGNWVKYP